MSLKPRAAEKRIRFKQVRFGNEPDDSEFRSAIKMFLVSAENVERNNLVDG